MNLKETHYFSLTALLLAVSANAFAIDPSLVSGTSWRVASFENGSRGDYQSVPWTFHSDETVKAGDLWKGTWRSLGKDRVRVGIVKENAETDNFDVVFFAPEWFIAVKDDQPYRLGRKRD